MATANGLPRDVASTEVSPRPPERKLATTHEAFATFFGRNETQNVDTSDVRAEGRQYLEAPLVVYELARSDNKGWVHDISERGLGLVGLETNIHQKKTLVIFAEECLAIHPCQVEAVCLWLQTGGQRNETVAGFQIVHISDDNRNKLLEPLPTLEVEERLR